MALYRDLIRAHVDWKDKYGEAIACFLREKATVLEAIRFDAHVRFDVDRFVASGETLIDGRRVASNSLRSYAEGLSGLAALSPTADEGVMLKELSQALSLRQAVRRGVTAEHFYDWVFGDYYSLTTTITFRGIPLDKLSLGQKGTVLLKLMLSEGDCPLLIDQAEEHLDNRYIFDELVGAIRAAKSRRPIILATNNPNLVVNADAEEVIVAESEDNQLSYRIGSIEKLDMRPELMPILEGGEEAFARV